MNLFSSKSAQVVLIVLGMMVVYGLGFTAGYAKDLSANSFERVFNEQVVKPKLGNADFNLFWTVADLIRTQYDGKVDYRNLVYGAAKGLVAGLGDVYSQFITPEENASFTDALNGRYEGVGIELELTESAAMVVGVMPDSPASAAGIKAKDLILAIDDEPIADKTLGEIVSKIRGTIGTNVKLTIGRGEEIKTLDIKRARITAPNVTLDWDGDVALLRIREFGPASERAFQQVENQILARKATGIVIDLRGNPGGLFDASVAIANEFLTSGTIAEERFKSGANKVFSADGKGRLSNIPVVILVDSGTASAAEILSAALRDNHRAQLVGEKTYGKGTIQEVEQFADGSALKITTGKWYTPSGQSLAENGLIPEVLIEDQVGGEDEQMQKAKELLGTS